MIPSIRCQSYIIAIALLLSAGVAPAPAQEGGTPVIVSADVDYRTRYLFAGIPFSTGNVLQGAVHIGYGGWTFNAFTNYDADLAQVNEADVWGDYYRQFTDLLGGFVGAAAYNFRFGDTWELTPEVYAGLALGVVGTPTLYFARDLDLTTGHHAVLSLTHGVPLSEAVGIEATGRVEYNNGYYREGSSFSYADLNISLPAALGPITVAPMITFVGGLADDFESRVVGGLNARVVIE